MIASADATPRRAFCFAAVAVWSCLLLAGLVLFWRRLAGVFDGPASDAAIGLAVSVVAIAGLGAYGLFRVGRGDAAADRFSAVATALTVLAPALFAVALSVGASALAGGFSAGGVVLTGLALVAAGNRGLNRLASRPAVGEAVAGSDEWASRWRSRPPSHSQRMARFPEQGRERIAGSIVAVIAAAAKQTTVHVAFVPPLATAPEAECRVRCAGVMREPPPAVGDESAEVDPASIQPRVADCRTYGLRIEPRRSGPANEAIWVEIEYSATG